MSRFCGLSTWHSLQVSRMSCRASQAPRARVLTDRKWKLLALGGNQVQHHIHHIVLAKVITVPLRFNGGQEMLPLHRKNVKNYVAIFNLPYLSFSVKLAFVLYFVLVHLSLPPTLSNSEQKKENRLCSCLGHSWGPGIHGNRDWEGGDQRTVRHPRDPQEYLGELWMSQVSEMSLGIIYLDNNRTLEDLVISCAYNKVQ